MDSSTPHKLKPGSRITFAPQREVLPVPLATLIQQESFSWFINEGVGEVLAEASPVEDYTGRGWVLTFDSYRFGQPRLTPLEAIRKGLTYQAPWSVGVTLLDKKSGEKKTQEIYMGDLPMMTGVGTFVINGTERVVINQLTRSEGVFFVSEEDMLSGQVLAGAKILPKNGAWLEFETARSGVLTCKIDRRRKVIATTLLRLFGLESDEKILTAFRDVDTDPDRSYLKLTLAKDPSKNYNEAVLEIYRRLRPGEPAVLENAKVLVEGMFFNSKRYSLGKVGRFRLNQKLGLSFPNDPDHWLLTNLDLMATLRRMIGINHGLAGSDDIDHLANRRVRSVGELVAMEMRKGFLRMERHIKERISLQPREVLPNPSLLVSARPVVSAVHAFFAQGQLSQFMQQTNPLDELDHLRRLSSMGPGGLTRERASFSVRDAHFSHYGRICPVRTPEGPNIGLVTNIALFARPNAYGFLETPYRRIVSEKDGRVRLTDEISYLAAYEEDEYYITDASLKTDPEGFILDERVPLRKAGEFILASPRQADFADVSSFQITGVSSSLIPFLANDDVGRALMGATMQAQAVPLLLPEAPLVGTGMEERIAHDSGRVILAKEAGEVVEADASRVVVKTQDNRKQTYDLPKFIRSNQETCYNTRLRVKEGERVSPGQIIADGPAISGGELALGTNLLIAYMCWEGYGYEDAILISDRLVKEDILSSIRISEYETEVRETKLGPEEITPDIPNVSEEVLRNLGEDGIVYIGAKVKPGDILVGKIAPKGEAELSAEERLLRAIFGEKAREVRDNSLLMAHGEEGCVIDVQTITREENNELPAGVIKVLKVRVAQIRKISVGDKLAGRHGNKGVISKIVSEEDLPHLPDGTPVDIIISPLSVAARMNMGQILEAHLGWAAQKLGYRVVVPSFVPLPEEVWQEELKKASLPTTGKVRLIDGRTGEFFDQETVVGYAYILKLVHMVEDKAHARSTGSYSLITQQPLGGKAQFGGQRFGEMEVWALEAYGAAHSLQEMLTLKSDDVTGRMRAFQAIVQGEPIPRSSVPESFRVLLRELNSLGLKIQMIQKEEPKNERL